MCHVLSLFRNVWFWCLATAFPVLEKHHSHGLSQLCQSQVLPSSLHKHNTISSGNEEREVVILRVVARVKVSRKVSYSGKMVSRQRKNILASTDTI